MKARLPLALRLARRELRSGLSGFRIFTICLVLGVGTIAGVGSLRQALVDGLRDQGRVLLGGDVELQLTHRPASADELAFLKGSGQLSRTIEMRAMVRPADGGEAALIELKAVDEAYPLYGAMALAPDMPLSEALALDASGTPGVVVETTLLERLGVGVGARLRLGDAEVIVRAAIKREPDRSGHGIAFGPRLMIAASSLPATGLVRPGSLLRHHYRLKLAEGIELTAWTAELQRRFPNAGWRLLDRNNAAPGVRRFVDRMGLFLTLVGLTALVVGGVGIANAVTSYLKGRTATIAVLKCVGARGRLIFQIYLVQVLMLAMLGIGLGLAFGALVPMALAGYLAERLPITAAIGVYPKVLALAAIYGVLIVLAFTIWPLAQAREVPAARLFRALAAPLRRRPGPFYIVLAGSALAALAALAIRYSGDAMLAGWFVAGTAASFAILRGAAALVMRGAARLPRSRHHRLRMAIANLHRPAAPTPIVTLSLGLGLTLMVTVALIEGNLSARVRDQLPQAAPSFFFIDIQADESAAFEALARRLPGVDEVKQVPMLRGRITRINGVPVERARIQPHAQWAVRGDRGLTYAREVPPGNRITAGQWWPPDYAGPPAISFDEELARGMGLSVGDTLTLNIMGREITARIASLRYIDWGTLALNFAIVFAPGTLETAPHSFLATVKARPERENAVHRALTKRFPGVTAIRMRDVLDAVNSLLSDIGAAIRTTNIVALLSGVIVLAGAMAAGRSERIYDAVVLKVLGARRRDLLATYVLEYALLGLIAATIAAGIGTLAAYLVLTRIMDMGWTFLPMTLIVTTLGAVAITVTLGLFGTWRVLGGKPTRVLRSE